MTRLILVRHGESNATVNRVVGGMVGCTGLSDLGRAQAGALRDRWVNHAGLPDARPDVQPDVLVASDMPRAVETAEIIAPAFAGLDLQLDPGLREMDPGHECDGLAWVDAMTLIGSADWELDPYLRGFPGGETLAAFQHRAAHALAGLASRYDGKVVVVVCHAGVIDVAFRLFLHLPFVGGFELGTVNASITELALQAPRWRLMRYNDAAHLADLPEATSRS